MRHPQRWLLAIVSVLLLTASGATAAPVETIEELTALFETDPAEAFVEAERMFEEEKAEGDLKGMMEVFRATAASWLSASSELPYSTFYSPLLEEMINAASPLARQAGEWFSLAELWTVRARIARRFSSGGCRPGQLRFLHFMTAAHDAFKTGGEHHQAFNAARADFDEMNAKQQQLTTSGKKWLSRNLGPEHGPVVADLEQAFIEGRDADAVGLMHDVIRALFDEPSEDHYLNAAHCVSRLLWIPGADEVIPSLRELVDKRGDPSEGFPLIIGYVGWTCLCSWTGRDDIYRDTAYWTIGHYVPGQHEVPWAFGDFACKLSEFGREAEALRMIEVFIDLVLQAPPERRRCSGFAAAYVRPGSPAAVRRTLVRLTSEEALRLGDPRRLLDAMTAMCAHLGSQAAGDDRVWAVETGVELLDVAPAFARAEHGVDVAKEAARLFDIAERPDLAQQARALARAVAANDPKTLLRCALAAAQSAAREAGWEDVVKGLEEATADQEPSASLLQAALLLHQAYRKLDEPRKAQAWLSRAQELLNQVKLSPASRANYLMNIASLSEAKGRKVSLLQQAQKAAEQSGLDVLQGKVTDRLATAALEAGDLAAAKQALLDIVNRSEQKRERLAFDPLLRQQWFADNIGPYRKLLRVAALQGDAHLALSTAERMRSRVLIDKLAWQKVDMGVGLSQEEQERLVELRVMRRKAYGLLQWVMGGEGPDESVEATGKRGKYMPIRGYYMPIRGLYMPIRGPLDKGEAATEEDAKRLQQLLEELAREEAALESAIRASVPAYEFASATEIPTGEQLARAVAKHSDLAVLHYTFADEGLVVVALHGGRSQVAFIEEDKEKLWERIGKFRELIWEQKEEVFKEAASLYGTLVSPVAEVVTGAKRLWVIADGALQLLPFNSLIGKDNVFLGWHFAVATAPSLSLALTSRGEREKPEKVAMILAAPDTGAISLSGKDDDKRGKYMPIRGMYMPVRGKYMPIRGEGGISSALTIMAMVPLPGAKEEGEAIAKFLPGAMLVTEKEATKARLVADGSKCDILHIATHGYADPDFPEFSGLLLAGHDREPYDVLTAQEVYLWSLRARLVTLSACQTALGKDVEGEGLIGLTRAFIYAGAQDVLCSLWPVSDESTKVLMAWFYANLAQEMTVEEALQGAQKVLIQAKDTNHPFYWAGFVPVRGPE